MGVALGLVLLASFLILGAGLGASSGLARCAAWAQRLIMPGHVARSEYFGAWGTSPLHYYLVFMLGGVFLGGLISAVQACRMSGNPALIESLQATDRSFTERQKQLDELIPAGTEQTVCNFLYILLEKNNIDLLGQVITTLEQMSRGGPQVQVAQVTTALELSANDKEQFQKTLRAKYGQNLEFTFRTDPSILGGAVVRPADQRAPVRQCAGWRRGRSRKYVHGFSKDTRCYGKRINRLGSSGGSAVRVIETALFD